MAKLGRAREHYESLRDMLTAAGRRRHGFYSYPVTPQVHREGLEYRFHVGEVPPFKPGERIAVIFGDFLFNLRAALDQIVYELHVRHFRGNIPNKIAETTQFPILSQPRRDKKGRLIPSSKWRDIKCLSTRQRRAIEWLQPYNRRNDDLFYARDALEALADLNNIDKHRSLHIAQEAIAAVIGQHFPPSTGFRYEVFWGPLVSNAEVYRWTFTDPPPDIAEHVNVNHEVTVGVRVHERGQPVEVIALAEHLLNQIERKIIPRLTTSLR